jgi:GNAT superfamily N-acetyltransferase
MWFFHNFPREYQMDQFHNEKVEKVEGIIPSTFLYQGAHTSMEKSDLFTIQPLTPERWHELEQLFGERGGYANCWCMFWRVKRTEFEMLKGEGRKASLKRLVDNGEVPGLLLYVEGRPAGWCSIGPRENYQAMERSRSLKRIDMQPVWSIVCFYVDKAYRKQGFMSKLVAAAVTYAKANGAKIVEAYPIDMQSVKLKGRGLSGCSGYMGIASAFLENGFVEAGRASETQLILRYIIQ